MNNEQLINAYKLDLLWIEQRIFELEPRVSRKPRTQIQINDLKHQKQHVEYQIMMLGVNYE